MEQSKRREKEVQNKNEELERQIYYLKQFQIALCSGNGQQQQSSSNDEEVGFSLESLVRAPPSRSYQNKTSSLNDSNHSDL